MAVRHDSTLPDVTIGVVGPRELVERILLLQTGPDAGGWRLVGASQNEEGETRDNVRRIADQVDVILFTGPLQSDLAHDGAEIAVPTTFVPISGTSLFSGLIRGMRTGDLDPERVTIDSLTERDVAEAYELAGLDSSAVRVHSYRDPASIARFTDFHLTAFRDGTSSGALTTVRSVATALQEAGVPALRLKPSMETVRTCVQTAALIGAGSRLEDRQVAIMVVEVAPAARPVSDLGTDFVFAEALLELRRELITVARQTGSILLDREPGRFVLVATMKVVVELTGGLQHTPLPGLTEPAGIRPPVIVGIGAAELPHAAELAAMEALGWARDGEAAAPAFLSGTTGRRIALPRPDQVTAPGQVVPSRAEQTLRRLLRALPDASPRTDRGGILVVDADTVAAVLAVSSRTARRILSELSDAGLAWGLPPSQPSGRGRPRLQYRLMTERLLAS